MIFGHYRIIEYFCIAKIPYTNSKTQVKTNQPSHESG